VPRRPCGNEVAHPDGPRGRADDGRPRRTERGSRRPCTTSIIGPSAPWTGHPWTGLQFDAETPVEIGDLEDVPDLCSRSVERQRTARGSTPFLGLEQDPQPAGVEEGHVADVDTDRIPARIEVVDEFVVQELTVMGVEFPRHRDVHLGVADLGLDLQRAAFWTGTASGDDGSRCAGSPTSRVGEDDG
jgi:hypothetical protein